jgi:hypothetical protein
VTSCPERSRISRELAVTIRDITKLKRERQGVPQDPGKIDTFFLLNQRLARLRTEYNRHIAEHGCTNANRAAKQNHGTAG